MRCAVPPYSLLTVLTCDRLCFWDGPEGRGYTAVVLAGDVIDAGRLMLAVPLEASPAPAATGHTLPIRPRLRESLQKGLAKYGIGYIYAMRHTLSWSPVDQAQIQAEFMALLTDPITGGDAAQLGLALKRLAQHTASTPPGPRLRRYVYPSGGLCAAFYAYESNNGTRIFVVGFCLEVDSLGSFLPVAQARLNNVP
jgi:hypothetical protein